MIRLRKKLRHIYAENECAIEAPRKDENSESLCLHKAIRRRILSEGEQREPDVLRSKTAALVFMLA